MAELQARSAIGGARDGLEAALARLPDDSELLWRGTARAGFDRKLDALRHDIRNALTVLEAAAAALEREHAALASTD